MVLELLDLIVSLCAVVTHDQHPEKCITDKHASHYEGAKVSNPAY